MKMLTFTDALIHDLYAHIETRSIFPQFKKYITSGPVIAMVLEREDTIRAARKMCGATDPSDAYPGTIRADFAKDLDNNVIHVSDSVESAEMEIMLFFDKNEIHSYKRVLIDD
jgi:nucleoside-diphosphate kinase